MCKSTQVVATDSDAYFYRSTEYSPKVKDNYV